MSAVYDYLFLELERGMAARTALVEGLKGLKSALAAAHGEPLGLFVPQLGWEAAEAALLIRWREERDEAALESITSLPQIKGALTDSLVATVRPSDDATLPAGGIFVHRWFETATANLEEFKALSAEGWKDFEPRFDARVFGLFLAEESQDDQMAGSRRLLLITRYADHGVWEASRDPSSEAMKSFSRRALLTRRTHGASTLLIPL